MGRPLIKPEFERHRKVMLETSRELQRRLLILGTIAKIDNNSAASGRVVEELETVCSFADWNPEHFLDCAEMATGVALCLLCFSGLLSGQTRKRAEAALLELTIKPGLVEFERDAFWVAAGTNWNVVCNAGLLLACRATGTAVPKESKRISALARSSIQNGLSGFGPDGGYVEGPAYWELAARYAILAHECCADTEDPLALPKGFGRGWRFHRASVGADGRYHNYGDTPMDSVRPPTLGWFAGKYGCREVAAEQRREPDKAHPFDLFWCSDPPGRTSGTRPRMERFPTAGATYIRRKLGNRDCWLALKHGDNSANHAHRDLGSFVLEVDGQRLVEDIGRGDYAATGYFDPARRVSHASVSTGNHSVLRFGQREQASDAIARTVDFCDTPALTRITLAFDDTDAPMDQLRSFIVEGDTITVVDRLRRRAHAGAALPIGWQLVTAGKVQANGNVLRLSRGGVNMYAKVFSPLSRNWHVAPLERDAPFLPGPSCQMVRFGALLKGREEYVVVLLSPDRRKLTIDPLRWEKLMCGELPSAASAARISEKSIG